MQFRNYRTYYAFRFNLRFYCNGIPAKIVKDVVLSWWSTGPEHDGSLEHWPAFFILYIWVTNNRN